jgi:DNA (cytosine-5)-methyltransferase 1
MRGGDKVEHIQEIIIDSFAGGGGASTGIEMAIGRSVDIAINHDEAAIKMHKANHPNTEHYCENVWEVDPVKAVKGRPVGLMWASPDCKHFSKAKGGKPVDKNIRGLAWVVVKWAKAVHPRVIILENVEEFKTWGPLLKNNYPDPARKGETFYQFVKSLKKFGYKVDWRELRACDYGAPTIRKRFFLIARCDGKTIKWPEPTHADPESIEVRCGLKKPWRTAAEIIDWSIPCPSIFERKKPLAENTLRRIAKGIQKFVIENPEPFIVQVNHSKANWDYCTSLHQPLATVTSHHGFGLVTPFLTQYHSYDDSARGQKLDEPILTLDTSNRYGLVAAFLTKYFGGFYDGCGNSIQEPAGTLTTKDRLGLVTSHIIQMNNHCDGQEVTKPLNTIVAGPGHLGEVRTFLMSYYGNRNDIGQRIDEPLRTITSKDRFGVVTVHGQDYQIVDIGMRMLEPRELFNAQGFPNDYIIDRDADGKEYPKTEQVARCGNAVPPPFAKALVEANLPEMCTSTDEISQIG